MNKGQYKYTWEEAIEILRRDPAHQELIYNSYLTTNLVENCRRFAEGDEFAATLKLLEKFAPGKKTILDMPGGNGIATYSFAKAGFEVTTVEPNPSDTVGRGAIHHTLREESLHANIVDAYGEKLPFESGSFDIVYVRQGLHHAGNLPAMLGEIARILRPGGVLLACREHVVDDYKQSLQRFLDSQPDHQLYGGENAFTLADYRQAMAASGMRISVELGPFDSQINMHPNTPDTLRDKIVGTVPGRLLGLVLPYDLVGRIGMWMLKRRKMPGRLYSFVAQKTTDR